VDSVDQHTETMVQQVIREQFKTHTLISIAHRLDTIVEFDRVVVLEKGCIVEEGNPRELLFSGRGKFRDLWDASRRVKDDTQ
jgi:ATP-binding cassette, subfamily C (CFTR/MRP), member 1